MKITVRPFRFLWCVSVTALGFYLVGPWALLIVALASLDNQEPNS